MMAYERGVYPTRVLLPLWARGLALRRALSVLRVSEFSVRRVSPKFDPVRGLARSPYWPDVKPTLDAREMLSAVKSRVPVDGREVVEWMQYSAADHIVMQARIAEYNRLGSQVVGDSGDPYIPGVSVEDVRFDSVRGAEVSRRGFAVARTPRGTFDVPDLGKQSGVFRDYLSWGSISWRGTIQWSGNLLKWKELARTPIRQAVGFFMDSRGHTAPNFFVQQPPRPALTVRVRQRFSSSDSQTLAIAFRDPTDYSNVLSTRTVDVPEGESEVTYTLSAFPYVPPLVAEIQPEDGKETRLEEYVVG